MVPANKQTQRRKIQGDVARMFSVSASIGTHSQTNQAVGPLAVVLYLTLLGVMMFGSFTYLTEWQTYLSLKRFLTAVSAENTSSSVVVEALPAEEKVVFVPPAHDAEQAANLEEVRTFLYQPEKFGHRLLGLPDIPLTETQKQWFMALLQTESLYYHFDPWGVPWAVLDRQGRALITSEEAHCVGVGQGCNLDVCPLEMWLELKTNIWCSAKHFRLSWEEHQGDVDRVLADYKGAWLMRDLDGDGYKDTLVYDEVTGLPLIDPLLYPQVQSVKNYIKTE